ncbi:MAG TPA: helix-turn-helix domain-containing protein [Micromonospora sp.]|nr:helix-turn-helix domain-containing protein [Micromonospora sp.]
MAEFPIRDVADPRVLRALAHPLRLRILEAVMFSGPLTATQVAELVDESPANCSWHLRQLARYGFVEEAGGGTGRQRPWRFVAQGNRWDAGEEGSALAEAGDAATEVLLEMEYQALRAWMRVRRAEPAHYLIQSAGWCTPEEMAEMGDEIRSIITRYMNRFTDPASRPPGSRPVRFIAWGIPALGHQTDQL